MELSSSETDTQPEIETAQDDTYSGDASFLYSSKINGTVDISGICEILVESNAFSLALDSSGRIFFKENGRLRTQILNIETTNSEMGMAVSGHSDFMIANPADSAVFSFSKALDLMLADKKLFNGAFGFPTESARIFMRPIAIRVDGDEEHELFVPYIRIYAGGIISISLTSVLGFEDLTAQEVVYRETNKSQANINSVLCEKTLHLACTECQISQIPFRERIAQKKGFEALINSTLGAPEKIEFADEILTVYELVHTSHFTLSDIARNLLSVVARAVYSGEVKTRINWVGKQYRDDSIGEYWHGKPVLNVRSHTRQQLSSAENWALHQVMVRSVMMRVYLADFVPHEFMPLSDMRTFDDFNSFYSESVSLSLSSAQVESYIENNSTYTFNNLVSDIQVLNEASHFILIYYSYASLGLDKCKKAIDVARLELHILKFEESLISAHKYGEIARYIEVVRRGSHLTTVCNILHKKVETVRKALELDEKISSESYTRRITVIFGIIASATLSPELMQPLAKLYGFTFDEQVGKVVGMAASVVVVVGILTLTHYVFRSFSSVLRKFRL